MKYLLFNGDSYSYGLDDLNFNKPFKKRYSSLLSNELNLTEINISTPGASNDTIVRTTLDWLSENEDKWNDLFVIIGWTISLREEHFNYKEKKWKVNKNWKKYEEEYAISEKTFNIRTRNNILLLQSFFKIHNIKYNFHIAFGENVSHYRNDKFIDKDNVLPISFMEYIENTNNSFFKKTVKWWNGTFKNGFYRHPTEDEHYEWFKYILNNVNFTDTAK